MSWYMYCVRPAPGQVDRSNVECVASAGAIGLPVTRMYPPFHELPAYATSCAPFRGTCPEAELAGREVVCVAHRVLLVWGIEQTVRLPTGESRRGTEVAAEVLAHRRRLFPPPAPGPPLAPVAYEAMNSVPDYWIPFLPVHVPGSNRSIQLQRAAMPSEIDQQPVRPRTAILREGLDSTPKTRYFINEEEVPQTGTRITVAYNRTRWRNGRAIVWLSTTRNTGRGEGPSGLAFDHLVDAPAAAQ
jgi:hypothetical protein